MADQKAAPEAADTPTEAKTAAAAAEAPAKAAEAAAPAAKASEAKPQAAKPAAKARKARAPKAGKAAPAAKAKAPRKAKKKAAQAARKTRTKAAPVRAGARKNEGVKTMNKQTRDTVDSGLFAADQFKSVFGDVNQRAKAAAERSAKIVEELADLTRGNVEALVASSKIAAKGVESMSQDAAEYSRRSFEEASTMFKSFAEVKSATDLFKLQGDYARAAFDQAVAESARMSETVLKLAGDVAEPITSRYTVAAERAKTLAA